MTVGRRDMRFHNMGRMMGSHLPGMREPNLAQPRGWLKESAAFRPRPDKGFPENAT
jgi:hypothetical protein